MVKTHLMCVLQGMIHDWDGGSDENIQSAGTSNINTGIQGDKDPRTWDGVDFNRQWVTNWSEFQNGESESETETEHLYSYSYGAGGRVKLHGTVAALALTHASLCPVSCTTVAPCPLLSCLRLSPVLWLVAFWFAGSGDFPFSEIEMRHLAVFIHSKPKIFGIMGYHTGV